MDETQQRVPEQHLSQNYGMVIDPSLARYFVDFEDVIDSLRLVLEGKDIDYQQDPPVMIKFGKPMMNEIGIGKIISKLKMLHKGIPMSNFEKNAPYLLTRWQSYTVLKELFVHMDNYGIETTDDAEKIVELVLVSLFAAYNRPVGEGERRFIKGYTKESHVITPAKKSRLSLS